MSTLLIKNIRTLVSCDSADTVYENVDLYAENGFIKAAIVRNMELVGVKESDFPPGFEI